MNVVESVFLAVACSGPLATLGGVGRAVLCFFRSISARNTLFSILSGLTILALLGLFATIFVVWFAYGVAHTGKNTATDLTVLASTLLPAYLCVFGVWRLSAYVEKRL